MKIQLIDNEDKVLFSEDLTGAKLKAFGHSMYTETHSGAEWEDLSNEECRQMIVLFQRLEGVCDDEISLEDDGDELVLAKKRQAKPAGPGLEP